MRRILITIFGLLFIGSLLAQERELKTDVLWHYTVKIGTDYGHSTKHLDGTFKNQDKLDVNIQNKWVLTDSVLTRKMKWIEDSKLKTQRFSYNVEQLSNITYRDSGEAGIFLDRTYITMNNAFLVTINHHTGYAEVKDLVDDVSYLSKEAQIIWYGDAKEREAARPQPTTWKRPKSFIRRKRSGPRR